MTTKEKKTAHAPGPWEQQGYAVCVAFNSDHCMKEALDQLEGIGIPEWSGAEGLCLTQARAAIAKAEGGAS